MKENRILQTKDLILKRGVFEDWKALYENLWSHEESAKYMLWRPTLSEEEAKERMRRSLKHQEESGLAWFIYRRNVETVGEETLEPIGFAGLIRLDEETCEDTGIAIGPAFVGKGYGKQVLNALTRYCFEELGAGRLICSCRAGNTASRALQLSCGFRYTHSEERVDPRDGEEYVLEFYERSREEQGI